MNIKEEVLCKIVSRGHEIGEKVRTVLKEHQLSEPQFNVLQILHSAEKRPLSVQEIGKRMIQKNSNITRLVDKLVECNLVQRQECALNRRKMDIWLTELGEKKIDLLSELVNQTKFKKLAQLEEKELESLNNLLDKLDENENN